MKFCFPLGIFFCPNAHKARSLDCFVAIGTIVSFIKKLANDITIANTNIGFAIRFKPIPQERITVISEDKLNLLSVITVESKTPIGIVITNTDGKFKIIIINATLNGIPYIEICLINVMNVSDAKIIAVKTNTPIKNISITCFKMYLSSNLSFLYNLIIFRINLF